VFVFSASASADAPSSQIVLPPRTDGSQWPVHFKRVGKRRCTLGADAIKNRFARVKFDEDAVAPVVANGIQQLAEHHRQMLKAARSLVFWRSKASSDLPFPSS
jgi:hypothetical protein